MANLMVDMDSVQETSHRRIWDMRSSNMTVLRVNSDVEAPSIDILILVQRMR
jgi:hypothetical protein